MKIIVIGRVNHKIWLHVPQVKGDRAFAEHLAKHLSKDDAVVAYRIRVDRGIVSVEWDSRTDLTALLEDGHLLAELQNNIFRISNRLKEELYVRSAQEVLGNLAFALEEPGFTQDSIPGSFQFGIEGMSCASCAAKIEKKLSKVSGVESVAVNFATKTASVTGFATRTEIYKAVEDAGYTPVKPKPEAVEKSASNSLHFGVSGMRCASCATKIEKRLKEVAGVENVAVNFATKTTTIWGKPSTSDLREALSELGDYTLETSLGSKSLSEQMAERELEELKTLKRDTIIAAILTAPSVIISMFMLSFPGSGLIQLLVTTPVMFWSGARFFKNAWRLAKSRSANMDTLVALGTGAAYGYSVFALFAGQMDLYFETAAIIITLLLLGKYLEERAKVHTAGSIRKLMQLQPKVARVIRDGQEVEISSDELVPGDTIVVKPGEAIPVDGVVIEGSSTVNESMITGESISVRKVIGESVIGATINGRGMLIFRAEKVGSDTVLARIVRLVENAQSSKAPIQRIADVVSGKFVPVVLGISALSLVGWLLTGSGLVAALTPAIAVLVIACPCSLGLATPTGIMAGTGRAAEEGILIKNAEALEKSHEIKALIFDKTGTLTQGKPQVTQIVNHLKITDTALLQCVAAAERYSEHPLGEAIVAYAQGQKLPMLEASNFQSITGQGVKAEVHLNSNGKAKTQLVVVGKSHLLKAEGIAIGELEKDFSEISARGETAVYVAIDGKPAAVFGIADALKPTSKEAVRLLKKMNIRLVMATGDNEETALAIAKQVGIDEVRAGLSPEDKVEIINQLKREGLTVGMVGDGINDAPALVSADIGFAIGTGTDIAMESAQVTLMKGDIAKVAAAIDLSRATMRIIKQNLFWAFFYNVLAIPVAAVGLLSPMIAAAAMATSSVSVVANSLRLKRYKKARVSDGS